MSAEILDGKALAQNTRDGLVDRATLLSKKLGRQVGLGVILVGEDAASRVYVRNKERAAGKVGIYSKVIRLPADSSIEMVLASVEEMNNATDIDAFLVQLPLPGELRAKETQVLETIYPQKDADGMHALNLGNLLCGRPSIRSCTPAGVMDLIDHSGIDVCGKHAVVIGRSTIVGKPVALMLLERHATVTICHSRTTDLAQEVGRADIVVAAVGRPEMVRGAWIKPDAVVIDVGINRVQDPGDPEAKGRLVGDVEFIEAKARAGYITPVPGGVGPMTVAKLLENAIVAAEAASALSVNR